MKVKVVIGANFGDEGKGLMTDYFCHQAFRRAESPAVVLNNGGPQRGHTVVTHSGGNHVFKHFGSGSFGCYCSIPTYIGNNYIVNPIVFNAERRELGFTPSCYVSPFCRVTTPWDMMANIIVEESRDERHGSCGMGIWETVLRNEDSISELHWNNILDFDVELIWQYYKDRFSRSDINLSDKWREIFYDLNIVKRFKSDIKEMYHSVKTEEGLFYADTIVIENGQGLLLSDDNIDYYPNVTASNTGLKPAVDYMKLLKLKGYHLNDIEVCYVSRTYMTRHGNGRFDTECSPADISKSIMPDKTNVFNPHQGNLRYGRLDIEDMISRCKNDFNDNIGCFADDARMSIAFTHADEYELQSLNKYADYISRGETRDDVEKMVED